MQLQFHVSSNLHTSRSLGFCFKNLFPVDTSRSKGDSEIDGQDYNFVSRTQFEEYIGKSYFVEHGEYEKAYYGASLDAIRSVKCPKLQTKTSNFILEIPN